MSHAGNGPHNWLVVYDPADPHGVSIARYYQEARKIPDRNLIAYEFTNNTGYEIRYRLSPDEGWALIEHLRSEIAARGLEGQIHGVMLVGQVPNSVDTNSPDSTASINTAISVSPNATSQSLWEGLTNDVSTAFRGPLSDTAPFLPTTEVRSDIEFEGNRYWLSTHLGYTGLLGLRRDEVFDLIDRTVAADGTAPQGTIYWPLNINIRSELREQQIAQVLPEWDSLGIDYHVFGQEYGGGSFTVPENKTGAPGSYPVEERAVQGVVAGSPFFAIEEAKSLYLPGAIAEHITSFGGQMGSSLRMSQTTATEWLRNGASGSSGTVVEPSARSDKFPHARIHSHYVRGATLAEAFWLSVELPWQLLILGDGLAQPYAEIPTVALTSPADGASLSGTVTLAVTANRPSGIEPDLDLAIDGRVIDIGGGAETVDASRVTGGFEIDTTSLTDGWHELRVIAYGADAIRPQGFAAIEIRVNNAGGSLGLFGPTSGTFGTDLTLTVTPTGLSGVSEIQVRTLGRVLATLGASGGTTTIAADELSDVSTNRVFAVAVLNSGAEVFSAPLEIDVTAAPLPALAEAATLPGTIAIARLFEDVKDSQFDWDTATPTAVVPVKGRWGLEVEREDQWPYLGDPAGNVGGVEFVTRYYAPDTGIFDFALGGIAQYDLLIDGQSLLGQERGGVQRPSIFLEKGWHELRFRSQLPGRASNSQNSFQPYYRDRETRRFHPQGHSLLDHAPFDLRRTAAPASSLTIPQLSGRVTSSGTADLTWTDPFAAETAWTVERYVGDPAVTLVAYHGTNTAPVLLDRFSPDALAPGAPVAVDVADDHYTHVPPLLQGAPRLITARADREDDGENTLYEVSVPAGVTVYAIQSAAVANPNPDWMKDQGGWTKVWAPDDNAVGFTVATKRTNRWIIKSKSFASATTLGLGSGFETNVDAPDALGDAITFVFVKDGAPWETVASLPADTTSTSISGLGSGTERFRVTASMAPVATIPSNELPLDLGTPTSNGSPSVEAGADRQVAGTSVNVPLAGSAVDDGLPASPGALTSTWSKLSGPGTATFADTSSLSTTVSFSATGVYELQLEADDGSLASTDTVLVTVTGSAASNVAPVVDAGPDVALNETETLSLAGSVSDDGLPAPPAQTWAEWRKVSGPGLVTFLDTTDPSTKAHFHAPGTYVLELSGSDGAKASSDTVTLTVSANTNMPPTVDAGEDVEITITDPTLALNPVVNDDGLPNPPATLTHTWSLLSGPGNATFADASAPATTVTFDDIGDYTLQLFVSDGVENASDTLVVTVAIDNAGNTAPVMSAEVTSERVFLHDVVFVNLSVTDDGLPDPPGELTLTWTKIAGPANVVNVTLDSLNEEEPGISALSSESTGREAIVVDEAGSYEFELRVSDGTATDVATIAFEVEPVQHRIIWVWGRNFSGEAGPWEPFGQSGLSQAYPVGRGWLEVCPEALATLALTRNGRVLASGSNTSQGLLLGFDDLVAQPVFAPVPGLSDVVDIANSDESGAAVHADGTISTWGTTRDGSLGDGILSNTRATPAKIPNFDNVTKVDGRYQTFFAIKEDGTLWAWGYGSYGKTGLGGSVDSPSPTQVLGVSNVVDVAAGRFHALALQEDGQVFASGLNFGGEIGRGTIFRGASFFDFTPVLTAADPETALTGIVDVEAGIFFSVFLDENRRVWMCGVNDDGQIGVGQGSDYEAHVAEQVQDPDDPTGFLTDIVDIAAADDTVFALKADGAVYAWGLNSFGLLGPGAIGQKSLVPIVVEGIPPMAEIWAGSDTAFGATDWADYDGFASMYFTPQQILDGEADRDFDFLGTGRSNVVYYALGLDPRQSGQQPIRVRQEGSEIVLEYDVMASAGDVEVILQASNNLGQWDDAEPVSRSREDLGDMARVITRFAIAPGEVKFLRLSVVSR